MKMTLYEISDAYKGLVTAIEDGTIDDDQAVADSLESIQATFDDKAESIALIHKSLTAEAEAIKKEADALLARATFKLRTADRLKKYLASNLQSIGQTKMETAKVKLSFRKSESVNIFDETALYAGCKASGIDGLVTVEEKYKFDKTNIKKAIRDGIALQGAEIVTNQNLQIK